MSDKSLIDVKCMIDGETEKALRVEYCGVMIWLPKSQISGIKYGKEIDTVTIPEWLAEDKELI